MPDTVKMEQPSEQTTVFALMRFTFQWVCKESKQINENVYIDCQKVINTMEKNKTGNILSIWWIRNLKMKCSHYKNGI